MTSLRSRLARRARLPIILVIAMGVTSTGALAASPTMVTAPGGSGACGPPTAVCAPGADVFTNFPTAPPVVVAGLGLVPGDIIMSLSWGFDIPGFLAAIHFSVSPGSVGVAGAPPDVFSEAAAGDAEADIFSSGGGGANSLVVDGNGLPAAAPPALGLVEPAPDDLTALASCDPTSPARVGAPAYFTLAPGSPTLAGIPATPNDILVKPFAVAGAPAIAFAGAAMGLGPGDVIDAIAIDSVSPGAPIFSLAPGSPSLTGPPFAGDLLGPGPAVLVSGAALGLAPGDDLDAVDIGADIDFDLVSRYCDNCPFTANNDQTDTDGDGIGDVCDPCPAGSVPFTAVRKVLVRYGSNGPGGADDKPRVIKAEFSSVAGFDPGGGDDVNVRFRDNFGGTLFSADLTTASGFWTQPDPTVKKWIYEDFTAPTTVGVRKALLKEVPPGSTDFRFKMIGKDATVGFPGGSVTLVVEIEPIGGSPICVESTLSTCILAFPVSAECRP